MVGAAEFPHVLQGKHRPRRPGGDGGWPARGALKAAAPASRADTQPGNRRRGGGGGQPATEVTAGAAGEGPRRQVGEGPRACVCADLPSRGVGPRGGRWMQALAAQLRFYKRGEPFYFRFFPVFSINQNISKWKPKTLKGT